MFTIGGIVGVISHMRYDWQKRQEKKESIQPKIAKKVIPIYSQFKKKQFKVRFYGSVSKTNNGGQTNIPKDYIMD